MWTLVQCIPVCQTVRWQCRAFSSSMSSVNWIFMESSQVWAEFIFHVNSYLLLENVSFVIIQNFVFSKMWVKKTTARWFCLREWLWKYLLSIYFLFSSLDLRSLGLAVNYLIILERSRILPLQIYLAFQQTHFEDNLFMLPWFIIFLMFLWLVRTTFGLDTQKLEVLCSSGGIFYQNSV